jgi:hypothetical protein
MTVRPPTYLDSSAIVRLVVAESESHALRTALIGRKPLVTSAIARVEVSRACLAVGDYALRRAQAALSRIETVRVSDDVLLLAGQLQPVTLGPLDCLHLATLRILARDVPATLVTYDRRMAEAAHDFGVAVESPGRRPDPS